MQKQKIGVIAAILLGVAIVVVGIVTVVHLFSNKTESYRSILVYELEGSAEIEREGTGSIKAVENLYLQSGDRIQLAAGSRMRLKLDDDKYIMVEEESVFRIEATGSKEDSKTSIYLEQGAITNEIQNKLSEQSSYEVTTPNSVMAVRGTIFRVEVYYDKNGDIYTKLSVFEGNVSIRLIYPDGTMGDEVLVEAGKEIIVHSNDKMAEYLGDPSDINYESFPLETLYILRELMEKGALLEGITREELEALIRKLETGENAEPDKEPTSTSEIKTDSEPDKKPTAEPNIKADTTPDTKPDIGLDTTADATADTTSDDKPDTTPDTTPDNTPDDKPDTAPDTTPDNTPDDKPDTTPDTTPDPDTKPDTEKTVHTVTFLYEGKVFGTQEVADGQFTQQPKLKPAAQGEWDFDFSKAVKEDLKIEWK